MADPRLGTHQQFDALRCRLCNKIYTRPKLLSCLHSFCEACLEKQEAELGDISANQITCPMCKEVVELPPVGGVRALTDNTLIARYIAQAHRDKTQMVAGREALELQRQALTETEFSTPEIQASMRQIADTAGHIIAGGGEQKNKEHDLDTVQTRQDLKTRTANLQEKALDIVASIDRVNLEAAEWSDNRNHVRDRIRARSTEIQNIVQGIERKLLACLDDKEVENELKNTCFEAKTRLHKTLKTDLTIVEFMKLLGEFGDSDDLGKFMPVVDEKERSVLGQTVDLKMESFMFDPPTVDVTEGLSMMFGGLTKCAEEKTAWDPMRSSPRHISSWSDSGQNSTSSETEPHSSTPNHGLKSDSTQLTNYTEVNENSNHGNSDGSNGDGSHEFGSRFSKRFEQTHTRTRRRPMKSMSFDAGIRSVPRMVPRNAEVQNQSDNDNNDSDNNANDEHTATTNENRNEDRIYSTIQSLNPNSERKSWARRVSAPSVIDSLNKRRLSALSILERANISTEGLNMTSDVESGLSEARLEWLRDNFQRKQGGNPRKPSTVQEEV